MAAARTWSSPVLEPFLHEPTRFKFVPKDSSYLKPRIRPHTSAALLCSQRRHAISYQYPSCDNEMSEAMSDAMWSLGSARRLVSVS